MIHCHYEECADTFHETVYFVAKTMIKTHADQMIIVKLKCNNQIH